MEVLTSNGHDFETNSAFETLPLDPYQPGYSTLKEPERPQTSDVALSPQTSLPLSTLPSSDRDSPYSLIEKDITTMDLELETPVDIAPTPEVTDTASELLALVTAEPTKIKDPEYFMETVVFEVEDTLYRVPTHHFRASTDFFTPQFESLVASGDHVSGSESVLKVDDVKKAEFRALLKLMYPLPLALTRTLSDDEWVSVLKLSTKWMMLNVREMAITNLRHKTSSVDKVILARTYSVFDWLPSAYAALARKAADLSPDDMNQIGLETTFKLHHASEQMLRAVSSCDIDCDHGTVIDTAFGSEFQGIQSAGQNAIECALMARKYNVMEWLRSALVELIGRPQSLSDEEASLLGYQTAIRVFRVREHRMLQGVHGSSVQSNDTLIDEELGMELHALNSRGPVDRVVLARKCRVVELLRSALIELAERGEQVSVEEAASLGFETAIQLCRVRQKPFTPVSTQSYMAHCKNAIDGQFETELGNVRRAGEFYRLPAELEEEKKAVSSNSAGGGGKKKKLKKK